MHSRSSKPKKACHDQRARARTAREACRDAGSSNRRGMSMIEDDPLIRWVAAWASASCPDARGRSQPALGAVAALPMPRPAGSLLGSSSFAMMTVAASIITPTVRTSCALPRPHFRKCLDRPLQQALNLRERRLERAGAQPPAARRAAYSGAAPRPPAALVDFDAAGHITAIGEYRDRFASSSEEIMAEGTGLEIDDVIVPDDDSASNLGELQPRAAARRPPAALRGRTF